MQLDPKNTSLLTDMERVNKLITCSELKKEGDEVFKQGDIEAAIKKYSSALEMDRCYVSAISNRAACYLKNGYFDLAINDCTFALELLDPVERNVSSASNNAKKLPISGGNSSFLQPSGPIPPPTSSDFRLWVIKTLVRRGSAYAQLERFKESKGDFLRAYELDPTNVAVAEDLARIRGRIAALEAKSM
jgi:dyslexia susceptibility 1 candidate gene 1 protein